MSADQPKSAGESGPSPTAFESFASAGFERLGLDADETMLAVISVVDSLYGPLIEALIASDLTDVSPEAGADMATPPGEIERR
jgi:hypothetical protein